MPLPLCAPRTFRRRCYKSCSVRVRVGVRVENALIGVFCDTVAMVKIVGKRRGKARKYKIT